MEAERLEDGKTVEVVCSMNGGGRKKIKKKEKKPWNSDGSSTEEWTVSEGERMAEKWEKEVEAALKEWVKWERKSRRR